MTASLFWPLPLWSGINSSIRGFFSDQGWPGYPINSTLSGKSRNYEESSSIYPTLCLWKEKDRGDSGRGLSAAYNQVLFGAPRHPLPSRTGNSDEAGPTPHSAQDTASSANPRWTAEFKPVDTRVRNKAEVTTSLSEYWDGTNLFLLEILSCCPATTFTAQIGVNCISERWCWESICLVINAQGTKIQRVNEYEVERFPESLDLWPLNPPAQKQMLVFFFF